MATKKVLTKAAEATGQEAAQQCHCQKKTNDTTFLAMLSQNGLLQYDTKQEPPKKAVVSFPKSSRLMHDAHDHKD